MSSSWPGSTMCTILLGSRRILLLARSRHWPAALYTVSPSGKRDMISWSTKRPHWPSLTAGRAPILRPNISSATWVGFWPPRQSTNWALAPPASAGASTKIAKARPSTGIACPNSRPRPSLSLPSSRKAHVEVDASIDARDRSGCRRDTGCPPARTRQESREPLLSADALDGGAAGGELVLQPLEAAVEVIDAIDHGLAFSRERGDDERDR